MQPILENLRSEFATRDLGWRMTAKEENREYEWPWTSRDSWRAWRAPASPRLQTPWTTSATVTYRSELRQRRGFSRRFLTENRWKEEMKWDYKEKGAKQMGRCWMHHQVIVKWVYPLSPTRVTNLNQWVTQYTFSSSEPLSRSILWLNPSRLSHMNNSVLST